MTVTLSLAFLPFSCLVRLPFFSFYAIIRSWHQPDFTHTHSLHRIVFLARCYTIQSFSHVSYSIPSSFYFQAYELPPFPANQIKYLIKIQSVGQVCCLSAHTWHRCTTFSSMILQHRQTVIHSCGLGFCFRLYRACISACSFFVGFFFLFFILLL